MPKQVPAYPMPETLPRLLAVEEARPILRMGTAKIYDYIRQKKIPSLKIGSRVFIPSKQLLEWLDKQVIETD
jgi:excisionase family DNA binding protein